MQHYATMQYLKDVVSKITALELGLGDSAPKSGHYAMLLCFQPLATMHYALGWVLLFSINKLVSLEFNFSLINIPEYMYCH